MIPDPSSPEVREALEELQLYLSDILPPLVVADAFKVLMGQPASLSASHIQKWTSGQFRAGSPIRLSDYIFYAVKKVFLIGEFRLVPLGPFDKYLGELKKLVLDFCPEEEREGLRANLARIAESTGALTASVDALIRGQSGVPEPGSSARAGPPFTPEELRSLRRFSLLLERLGRQVPGVGVLEPDGAPVTLAQVIAAAARSSRDPQELEQNLDRLREIGLEIETADIFRALAKSLPGWVPPELPPPPAEDDSEQGEPAPPPESGAVDAMHRIVVQAENPAQVAHRFHEMVKAAVERFNEGALPQAVTMLELADRIAKEECVDAGMVESVRLKGDETLDLERLRTYAEAQQDHALLRRVLSFFTATSPKGLMTELLREMKRERRKLILQLLEVHGPAARHEALGRLRSAFGQGEGDEKWFFRRNLLYLLRRIPPARDVPSDEDLDTAVRHAVLRFPAPLVKEAVANLGQLRHERAEVALLTLLDDLEKMLLKPTESAYDPREVRLILDRVVAALARFGSAKARRAVMEHGLKKKGELGDTMARLSELAGQDLSTDPEVVERLLAALKANAPYKVLGIVLHSNDQNAKHLIEALSTTPAPAVREALEGLAGKFPNLEVGKAASRALATLDGSVQIPEIPFDTRSGELEFFGLPGLIQDLAESGLSGSVSLKDKAGEIAGEVVLSEGKMKSCQARGLTGEEAFYQLIERPFAGSFFFQRRTSEELGEQPPGSHTEVLPLCLEGMRRYDELQQAAALVPDDQKLEPTEVRPEHHPDELDGMFVNGLWKLASGGATPLECEAALKADAYRIRRQLAHWIETGALAPA